MPKKIYVILMSAIILSSCSLQEEKKNENINSEATENSTLPEFQIQGSDDISIETIKNEDAEAQINDFAFYNMDGELIISLFSREDDIDYDNPEIVSALSGFDIIEYDEVEEGDAFVKKILFLKGCNIMVQTGKMLKTAGFSGRNFDVSVEKDIIEAYNIDTEKDAYISREDNMYKYITLYFKYNKDGSIDRKTYSKETDISDFQALTDANIFITFGVDKENGNIMSIDMEYKM